MRATILLAVSAVASFHVPGAAGAPCPATTADDPLFGTSIPGWYGTQALAVKLSSPARWPTTQPGFLIGEKLLWRSAGFRPGLESNLKIAVRNLNGGPVTGRISEATNAYLPDQTKARPRTDDEAGTLVYEPHGWYMMNGVDFRGAGCWEVTASYLGQKLTFVVETVK